MTDIKPISVVEGQFGQESAEVMEVLLSAHATHLLDGTKAGLGIMIEGPSGGGKTTLLRSYFGLDEQIYRSDDLTPASFLSHDASKSEEELEKIDLLPRIRDKTLVVKDMASWFSGPEEQIRKKWSVFADAMDGGGLTSDSGSHGRRSQTGDYRFNFLGATTPIPPRGHRVMGHVGPRLLFVELSSTKSTRDIADEVLGEDSYETKVDKCNKATRYYLKELWNEYDGVQSVRTKSVASETVKDYISYLADLTRYARATIVDGSPQREEPPRLISLFYTLAKGHALLHDREEVCIDDLEIATRTALDTMPSKRRPIVRELLHPDRNDTLKTKWIAAAADVSLPTARRLMDEMDTLGIGMASNPESTEAKTITLNPEFAWPTKFPNPIK